MMKIKEFEFCKKNYYLRTNDIRVLALLQKGIGKMDKTKYYEDLNEALDDYLSDRWNVILEMCRTENKNVYFALDAMDEEHIEKMLGYWGCYVLDEEIAFVRDYLNSKNKGLKNRTFGIIHNCSKKGKKIKNKIQKIHKIISE